ncbi:hypothetical protein FCL49_09430 [Serratia proteamaculans]|uniref:hypothetical protein n=1 Tax=Serratia proteamaculans TaxID=28151 RepID=UPI001575B794|nr:hypothetical protein [Serratia proteamaculans]NTX77440.1 hypothetical protein [Serratia proteamaculans]NTZ28317.1 hypothetical protein [Serratia proteamaculans]
MNIRSKLVLVTLAMMMVTPNALAACDAHKAARNAAMDATVGVSGGCNAKKATKNAVSDNLNVGDKKDNVTEKKDNVKSGVSDARDTSKKVKDAVDGK